ncbi:MAG: MATE family efflux transporter [Oscillospiraceae bacterium]|nr:MATE family efflux transporter [Oscillospiraceae bacterium]
MFKNKIKSFFSNEDFKLIFAMFFPVLIEQLILSLMATVYSLMLARVKTDAVYIVSAVNLVEQLNQLAYALLGSVSLGATVVVSQYIGAGKPDSAKHTAEQAVTLGVLLAVIVMCVYILLPKQIFSLFLGKDKTEGITFIYSMKYMKLSALSYPMLNIGTTAAGVVRGTGDAKSAMRISIVIGIVNAVVAGFCIYALNLNVYGAGIASIVSRSCGAAVAVALLVRKGFIDKFSNLLKPKFLYIKQIVRIGMYESAESMIFQFGRTITYRFLIGEAHIAANSVTNSVFNIISAPGNSMSIVSMALVGRLTGAGDKKKSYKVLRNVVLLSMGLLLLANFIFLPFSPFLVSLYTSKFDPNILTETRSLIYHLIILDAIFMPTTWSSAFVLFAGMKGAGDVRFTTSVSIISMWLMRVLFAYILGGLLGWGVVGVWCGMFFDWVFRSAFGVWRFRSRKWQEKSAIKDG